MFPKLPPVTKALLIANVTVFVLQLVVGAPATLPFKLWPIGSSMLPSGGFGPWQLLTSGFMHADFGHLAFNMLALWMFGSPLELVWGEKRFLTYYLACLLGAGVCHLLFASWLLAEHGQLAVALGASGAVFGLLLGYGMLFPNLRLVLFPFPVTLKARTLVIICGVTELVFAYTGWQPGIAHMAHLGGMLFGWLLIRHWRNNPPPARGSKPRSKRPPLRIVK